MSGVVYIGCPFIRFGMFSWHVSSGVDQVYECMCVRERVCVYKYAYLWVNSHLLAFLLRLHLTLTHCFVLCGAGNRQCFTAPSCSAEFFIPAS